MPAVAIQAVECDIHMGKCCGASEQEAVVLFHERLRELRFFLAERPPDAAGGGHTKPRRRIVEHDRDGGSELDAAVAADHPGEEKASERRRARFEALLSALAGGSAERGGGLLGRRGAGSGKSPGR